MNLATWLPNKTLLWKEWRQTWAPAAVLLAVVAYYSSYTLLTEIGIFKAGLIKGYGYTLYLTRNLLSLNRGDFGFFSVLVVVGLGALLMGREREEGTFNLLLSMPHSRRDIIYHKFLAAAGAVLAVYAINALLMSVLLWTNPEVVFPFGVGQVWTWAALSAVVLVFCLSFTFLISTVSGTTAGNWVLSLIFLFLPYGFAGLVYLNMDLLNVLSLLSRPYEGPPYIFRIGELLTVPGYIMGVKLHPSNGYPQAGVYPMLLIATAVIHQLTQYLFARNPMENNGEVLIFNGLEPVLKLGVAVCFALLLVPVLRSTMVLSLAAMIIAYLVTAALFWAFVTWLIRWRRQA